MAAKKFFRQLLKGLHYPPPVVVTRVVVTSTVKLIMIDPDDPGATRYRHTQPAPSPPCTLRDHVINPILAGIRSPHRRRNPPPLDPRGLWLRSPPLRRANPPP